MQMKGREPEHVKHAARLAGAPLQTAGTDLSARPSSWKLHGVRGLHHQLELQCSVGLASVHCSAQQAAGSQHTSQHQAHPFCSKQKQAPPAAHQPVSHTVARVEITPASAGGAGHRRAAALYQAAPHRPTAAPMRGNHITAAD